MKYAVGTPNMSETPEKSEEEQRAFLETVMARTSTADAHGRTGEYFLAIAGVHIRLLFASETLQREFLPALAHLQTDRVSQPDATFHIWTSAETGIDMIAAPCAQDCFTSRGDIWGFDSPRFRSAFHWSEYSLSLMDMRTGQGTFWVETADNLPYWSKASPLRTLFHWLMAQHGCQLLHAAAVGTEDGGLLISGKGGVGKSTTALACLAAGMKYVADDYLVVRLDPQPAAFSLYGTAKLEVLQMQRFPALQSLLAGTAIPENEKAVLNLQSDKFRITPCLPLVAALTPSFAAQLETTIRPATLDRLLHSASFTTMTQLPHTGRATYEYINRLMERLPCFELLLGSDIDAVPAALKTFLGEKRNRAIAAPVDKKHLARPFISVIVPAYNGANFLREAVDSILAQNYSPLEIIVIDDGSTDDLASAIRELKTDVRLLEQHNLGPAAARNLGIRNAAGELIAFLDIDDLWPPETLATLADRLTECPGFDVVHGYGQLIKNDGGNGQKFIGDARESFLYYVGAALYRRRAFEQIGFFDPDLRFSEDTDWFARAREKGLSIERLERVTLLVRRHAGNMTKNKNLQELGALRVVKKALDRRRGRDANGR